MVSAIDWELLEQSFKPFLLSARDLRRRRWQEIGGLWSHAQDDLGTDVPNVGIGLTGLPDLRMSEAY